MPKTAHIVPDTNLFMQCKPLDELDWSIFAHYDEVLLILTNPVVKEIDNHKSSGTKRLAKKARAANRIIGQIIDSPNDYIEINTKTNNTTLKVKHLSAHPTYEHEALDTRENDDKIVSIAKAYSEAKADEYVVLVTNDNGPILKAKAVGLEFLRPPENWALSPEKDENEKELERVKKELEKMQQNYPKVVIKKEKIEFEKSYYSKLKKSEIDYLMDEITNHIPISNNFEQTEIDKKKERNFQIIANLMQFKPATEEQIEEYKTKLFPNWLERCREELENFHKKLNRSIDFPTGNISIENSGGQPAKDSLVKFYPRGNFSLMGISQSDGEDSEDENLSTELPLPPAPPRGEWRKPIPAMFGGDFHIPGGHHVFDRLPDISPHDPNIFYWESKKPTKPGGNLSLTCTLWRHGTGEENFSFNFIPDEFEAGMTGSILCEVHASNLVSPANEVIPVKIKLSHISCYEKANEAVNELIQKYKDQ